MGALVTTEVERACVLLTVPTDVLLTGVVGAIVVGVVVLTAKSINPYPAK